MGLNIDINKVSNMKTDINTILTNTSESYDNIVNLISNISSDWSTEGSSTYIEKLTSLTSTFDNYTTTLKNVVDYLSQTEEDYQDVQTKVEQILNVK